MGVKWTEEQQKVIQLRNRNILVSAAAGSGKTAVLVERIITMLTEDDPPVDVDKLLIVTFTEAAASEMKERIRLAIEKKLLEYPEDEHLKQQATLIHNAQITTIHSFCLSVIRDHFHAIDIDPGFRIGEEGELKLLRHDVLEEMLEEKYQEGNKRFLDFAAAYSTGRDDKKIEDLILKIYEFSRSYPDSEEWLDSCVKVYGIPDVKTLEESSFMKKVMTDIRKNLDDARELLAHAEKIALSPDGPAVYEATLDKDMQVIEDLSGIPSYEKMAEAFANVKWARIAANKDKTVSEEKIEQVKKIRELVKGIVKNISGQYFYESPQELVEDLKLCAPAMEELGDLVRLFAEKFEEQKRAQNMIDFSDMEQYALRILTEKTEAGLGPSKIAEEYQKQFQEIMIDEYQDSNLIQEAILTSVSTCRSGRYNIFMVGDVKQSIYRFRLSRPELFLEKFHTYNIEESQTQRIDLHKNFRSRKEVLEGANAIFRQIMTEKLGGIVYDKQAALYPGAEYPKTENLETEILVMDGDLDGYQENDAVEEENSTGNTDKDTGKGIVSERELEARMIAMRIRELLRSQKVTDKETGELRDVRYSDIVILTRSIKGFADVFTEVLNREGIPTYAGTSEGYFQTQEIGVLLDYLRVLDNRRQDIPLAAVLSSAFAEISDEELAVIRCAYPDKPFFESVAEYRVHGSEQKIREKLEKCLGEMDELRRIVPYTPMHELLWKILDRTGYGDYVAAMPGGAQRRANLDMLIEKARAYEATSYKGLFHFVRYIEQLQKYDVDYGEASIEDEHADTVRVMTIHKSKGLEFPVVIVAGMGKRFNMQDARSAVALHAGMGVGLDAVNLEYRTKIPSIIKKVIQKEEALESLGEELRVLYVALTRAKEKLILTGTVKKIEDYQAVQAEARDWQEEKLPYGMREGARCYWDWIFPALAGANEEFPVQILEMEHLITDQVTDREDRVRQRAAYETWDPQEVFDATIRKDLEEKFSYVYPYGYLQEIPAKVSVSELKKQGREEPEEETVYLYEEKEQEPIIPDFMKESREPLLQGAARGTAYHRILECLDYSKADSQQAIEKQIEELLKEEKISKEAAKVVRSSQISWFVRSAVGKRMKEAFVLGTLHREQQFVMSIDASERNLAWNQGEQILVQGIIDAFWEEADGLVLVDYKTDHVKEGQELIDRYQRQMHYYSQALERAYGKKVKECYLYSFALGKAVAVEV